MWFKALDPLVLIYQEEKRQPTEEEKEKSLAIAKEAVFKATLQNFVIMVVSIFV